MLGALGQGFVVTAQLFFLTLLGSLPLGVLVALGRMSKFLPLQWLMRAYISIMRGTPLMLQMFAIYFAPYYVFGLNLSTDSKWVATVIAFIINYAAYFSEIYRGGIESIPKGQYEAGQVLGMTRTQIFFHVILAQVIKRIVPPMSNEIITLVKDTSLARIIAVREIIMEAQSFISTYALIWPLFYSGAFYLVFNGLLTLLFGYIEKKMDYYKV